MSALSAFGRTAVRCIGAAAMNVIHSFPAAQEGARSVPPGGGSNLCRIAAADRLPVKFLRARNGCFSQGWIHAQSINKLLNPNRLRAGHDEAN
jgi:hypothetical protein